MREITKKKQRKICIICHKKFFWISQHGLCKNCMTAKIRSANYQMKAKEGPIYEKWKRRIKESLEKL